MLIKRNNFMTSKVNAVKKSRVVPAIVAGVLAMTFGHSAQAQSPSVTGQVITAKFLAKDLQTKEGTQSVYASLEKKAKRSCRISNSVMQVGYKWRKNCADDLVDQFITSAGIESLQAYHLAQKPADSVMELALKDF